MGTELVIGPNSKKPLRLDIPLFVSGMSFGALSEEAKVALSKGAELTGTGICPGEGGTLPEEQAENSRYFYELASAKFGFSEDLLKRVQAFHFKAGQGAKPGTGAICPATRSRERFFKFESWRKGRTRFRPQPSPSSPPQLTTDGFPNGCES